MNQRPLLSSARRLPLGAAVLLSFCCQSLAAQAPHSLVQSWLLFPDVVDVAWPYAYIRARGDGENEQGARQDLFDEYNRLDWRLKDDRLLHYSATVESWRQALSADTPFRTPGNWTPSFLMSHVNQNPPLASVAAIGSCDVPKFVTVWDADGARKINWRAGMRLSDLEELAPMLRKGSTPEVAVINPFGEIDHYGVQAWNYADGPIAPGSHVVASLPLHGNAFAWIQDAMSKLIAHMPSGTDCREQMVDQGETPVNG